MAGITDQWSRGEGHRLPYDMTKIHQLGPSSFTFNSSKSYPWLEFWRRSLLFKPVKRMMFVIPKPVEEDPIEQKNLCSAALRFVHEFFSSLQYPTSTPWITDISLDLGCISSSNEFEARDILKFLDLATRTGCKSISLRSIPTRISPTPSFTQSAIASMHSNALLYPSLEKLRVTGSIFLSSEILPWVFSNISSSKAISDLGLLKTSLPTPELSTFSRCIRLGSLKKFEMEDIALWDLWVLLHGHPNIEDIQLRYLSPDADCSSAFREDVLAIGPAPLANLRAVRGSARQVAQLLPLIDIKKNPAHLPTLELLLTKKENYDFDVEQIFQVFHQLIARNIIMFHFMIHVASPANFELLSNISTSERLEKRLAVHTVTILVDARLCSGDNVPIFFVSYLSPVCVSLLNLQILMVSRIKSLNGSVIFLCYDALCLHFAIPN
ncbi:hypothetical protein SCHPADRAFT_947983 [Schizopora paradoxa]|uniref:F-box domain-containing protein n=1 Tax=Schizopora paradoxa TaxID=27342 RepID=A0A0H2RGR3_9AGAM|nr:hypothetical protein SCHPADRAFT_947983 [Schizopora paradoxa]